MWRCPQCGQEYPNQDEAHTCDASCSPIVQYIMQQPEASHAHLIEIYEILKTVLPEAEEKIAWRMPTFWDGGNLIHFAAFKNHVGLFPGGEIPRIFAQKLEGYKTGKGSIQFPFDEPLPKALIIEIAQWCKEHNKK